MVLTPDAPDGLNFSTTEIPTQRP